MAGKNAFDSKLVKKAQQGDSAAREHLMKALNPLLRAFFIKRIGFKTEVDDLIQNTLLRVHKGLSDLKDHSSLKAFAMKAALFELQDFYRGRYSAKESLYDPDHAPGDDTDEMPTPTQMDLERALSALSPKARRIIELREYGYRYEEIADIVGSTEAAIKMQVKRAFEKMRDMLIGLLLTVFASQLS
ncbi:MAG: RNA polymerase sigma factor [Rhodothermales bacterium]